MRVNLCLLSSSELTRSTPSSGLSNTFGEAVATRYQVQSVNDQNSEFLLSYELLSKKFSSQELGSSERIIRGQKPKKLKPIDFSFHV